MKNDLLFTRNEIELLEESIENWREHKESNSKHDFFNETILAKLKANIDNPDFDGIIDLGNGQMAQVPITLLKGNPGILESFERMFKSDKKDPMHYKEIVYKLTKKLHDINKFLSDFDDVQISKVREEVDTITK